MKEGYIPSETDIGAFMDAERGIARHGNGWWPSCKNR
jgi:hypothetical protein